VSSSRLTKFVLFLVLLCLAPFSLGLNLPRAAGKTSPTETPPPPVVHFRGDYVHTEVLVRLEGVRAPRRLLNKCLTNVEFQVKSTIDALQTLVLEVPDGTVADAIGALRRCSGITRAEPNYVVQAADVYPSDPGWVNQYGLTAIRAPQGWQITTGSPAVMIAIVDTGIQLSHPDLSAKIVSGYDFVNGDAVANDDNGHGTHVAGIAAAQTDNGVGVAGVSWGALLMPIKVLDSAGNGSYGNVSQGIIWATDHGAQIINLSLGGIAPSATLQGAVDYAYSHGVTLVAAAGNTGANFVLYPARYPNVIAVGATDSTNAHAGFSNFGPELDLSAPGVSIYSTQFGSYGFRNGTSMSAPFVSGLAAILRGIPGNGSPDVIAWEMESTALDLGPGGLDDVYGYGLIQMDAAIQLAWPGTVPGGGGRVRGPSFGGLAFTATTTFSPTPTWTPTASVTPTVLTRTPLPSATTTASPTATLSVQQMIASRFGRDWSVGCWGVVLILLGILLAWILSRRRQHRAHRQYFRM
jgi:subtilisin family serine protease